MQFYPEPNLPGNTFTRLNNFFNSGSRTVNEYQTTAKVDHNFSARQRLSARYSQARIKGMSPDLWGNWMNPYDDGPGDPAISPNGSADYTNTLTATTGESPMGRGAPVRRSRAVLRTMPGVRYRSVRIPGTDEYADPAEPPTRRISGARDTAPGPECPGEDVNHFVLTFPNCRRSYYDVRRRGSNFPAE